MVDHATHAKKLDLLGGAIITTTTIRAQLCHFMLINAGGPNVDLDDVYNMLDQIDRELEAAKLAIERENVVKPPQPSRAIVCPSCGGAPHSIPRDQQEHLTCRYCGTSWHR